jgi:hypothetical protein
LVSEKLVYKRMPHVFSFSWNLTWWFVRIVIPLGLVMTESVMVHTN